MYVGMTSTNKSMCSVIKNLQLNFFFMHTCRNPGCRKQSAEEEEEQRRGEGLDVISDDTFLNSEHPQPQNISQQREGDERERKNNLKVPNVTPRPQRKRRNRTSAELNK